MVYEPSLKLLALSFCDHGYFIALISYLTFTLQFASLYVQSEKRWGTELLVFQQSWFNGL